jgi:hypothetical protein
VEELHQQLSSASSDDNFEKTSVEAVVKHGGDTVRGPIDAVFPEIDSRTVSSVEFRVGGRRYSYDSPLAVKFNFRDNSLDPAVKLEVGDSDRGWVNQALAGLAEEVGKGVPRWANIQRFWVHLLVLIASIIVFTYSLTRIFSTFIPNPWHLVASNILGFLIVVPFTFSDRAWIWLFPRVELKAPGGDSTGSRRFLALCGIAVAIAAGIFVNTIK